MSSKKEKELINPSDVYSVTLGNKEFFYLLDIGDGNFIGINAENNIFEITHDPIQINMLERDRLASIIERNLEN